MVEQPAAKMILKILVDKSIESVYTDNKKKGRKRDERWSNCFS